MPKKDTSRIQMTLDVLAVVFSLIAVGVSLWSNRLSNDANTLAKEANELSSQEYAAKVVVLSTEYRSSENWVEPDVNYLTCSYNINMVNLGGVATSITDFQPIGYFGDAVENLRWLSYSSDSANPLSPRIQDMYSIAMSAQEYDVYIDTRTINVNEKGYLDELMNFDLQTPFRLEPKDTLSLVVSSWFKVPIAPDHPNPTTFAFEGDQYVGISPIEVAYKFELASGEVVTTSKQTCFYMN